MASDANRAVIHGSRRSLMRVLLSSTSGQGHIQPLLALARSFDERGDATLIAVAASAAPSLSDAGFNVLASDEPDELKAAQLWSRFADLPRNEASRLVEREWFAGLCVEAMLPCLEKAVRDWAPDLVVRETCEYAGAVVADRARIPHVQQGISTATAEMSVLRDLVGIKLDSYSPGLAKRVAGSPYLTRLPLHRWTPRTTRSSRFATVITERAAPTVLTELVARINGATGLCHARHRRNRHARGSSNTANGTQRSLGSRRPRPRRNRTSRTRHRSAR